MNMFADILWWVMAAAAGFGFLAVVVESCIVLEFIHTGRIPHIFGEEYKISTSVFIGTNILLAISILLFILYPQYLNILYETRTFLVWLYVAVMNAFLITTYALPRLRDLRGILGAPHRIENMPKKQESIRVMYVSYIGIMLAHSTILLISYAKVFDQVPSKQLLMFLIAVTVLSGSLMPFLYKLRVSLKNNL